MELNKIDKYVSKFADKVDYSSTTNSRYYYVCNHCLRISDHGSYKPSCDWSIIFDQRNPSNYILMGGKTTSLTVLKYEEVKSFVKSWVLTSQTTPAKMSDDNNKILSKINLKLEEIKNYISAKPKSADDLVDVSKLTVKQLKEVQGIILENELAKNNLTMTFGMNEFTPSQRNTILGFLKQNKGKHFK